MQDPRFPIQWVIRPQFGRSTDFRAFAGQVASGVFRIGDLVTVLPSGMQSRIQDIQLMGRSLEVAHAPMSVSLLLEDMIDVSRGDLIVSSDNLPYVGKELEAMICWMDETPLQLGKKYLIKHTTHSTKVLVRNLHYQLNINDLKEDPAHVLRLNEIGRISLQTATPLLYDRYHRNRSLGGFVLIDESSHATAGAGMLEEPTKPSPLPGHVDYSI